MSTGTILVIALSAAIIVVWTIRYITRLQTKRNARQDQLDYLAKLIELTGHAFISTDLDLIRSWNRAAEELYGYSAQETIGRPLLDFIKSASTEKENAEIQEVIAQYGSWKGEVRHLHKNGRPLYLLLSVTQIHDRTQKKTGYVIVSQDLSERRAAEEQLRTFNRQLEKMVMEKTAELTTVFQRVSDGFMAFDKTGRITYANDKAAEHNNLRPDQLVGKCIWEHFPTAAGNEFGKNFRLAIDTQTEKHFEMFSPGLQLWIECFIYPSEDGLSVFFRDISAQRTAQETIQRSSQELRELASHLQEIREEERSAIAREIHDELGQQLTAIKMDLAWLYKRCNQPESPLGSRITETLGLVDHTIKTVRRIATDLHPGILDDLGLIAAIEWQSQEFQKRSGISTHFHSSLAEFQFTPAASICLFRICQESLTNVARHSGASHVWIDLDWTDNELVLAIRDNGKGLHQQEIEGRKTLGLLGMRERALMMGGSLNIHSSEGKGFTLEVTVPLKEPLYQ